ncbi:MAG: hypothetical protein AAF961_11175, partial [Planctomycetota bacterium]
MSALRRWQAVALVPFFAIGSVVVDQPAAAQDVRYEAGPDGGRIQVTTTRVQTQVPVTEYREQNQTFYRQQM